MFLMITYTAGKTITVQQVPASDPIFIESYTVCDPSYVVTYYIKWVTTSWTCSTYLYLV